MTAGAEKLPLVNLVGLVFGFLKPLFGQRQESMDGHASTSVGKERRVVTSNTIEVDVVAQSLDSLMPYSEFSPRLA
jgi:hypothetical protein